MLTVKIQVSDRININIPFKALQIMLKADIDSSLLQASNSLKNIDFNEIAKLVEEGNLGEIMHKDLEDNETLTITVN